jgi:Lipocalin-like domain
MTRSASMLVFSAIALGAISLASHASAQGSLKAQIVGSWTFVSGGSTDSSGRPVWGEGARGLLIFLENGRYSSQLMRADLPKFTVASRLQGTPEENKAIVQGTVSSFGTYTIDESKKAFTIQWEAHTFPNMTGQSQTRSSTVTGDELRIQNPGPTAGGPPSELVYRRSAP